MGLSQKARFIFQGANEVKLEAGKKYKTRNGKIVECVATWTKPVHGYGAAIVMDGELWWYVIDGRYAPYLTESEDDCISEYLEPKTIATYAVPYDGAGYRIQMFEVGKEPKYALKIEGSEREIK